MSSNLGVHKSHLKLLNRQRPGPAWQRPAVGHKDLRFYGLLLAGCRRGQSPASMWKPSLQQLPRLLFPEKRKYQAKPPPLYVLLPSNSSQAGEHTTQLPGKDEVPHGADLRTVGCSGLGPTPCPTATRAWRALSARRSQQSGSQMAPEAGSSAMRLGWCKEKGHVDLFMICLSVHSY